MVKLACRFWSWARVSDVSDIFFLKGEVGGFGLVAWVLLTVGMR